MLEEARAQGCHVAVFPEFSLTGSVDPRRHPERALTLDADPIQELLDATLLTGVAASWRNGHAWWVWQGLGNAIRHALSVPVAMATQAGSTEDEDFPGLAALVLPSGEVARLPDWRAGTLIVEVAANP